MATPKDTIDIEPKVNPFHEKKISEGSSLYKPFKARPIPSTIRQSCGQVGVPKVTKRPTTKAISPKLGRMRKSHQKEIRASKGKAVFKVESPPEDLVGINFLNKTPSEKENQPPTYSVKIAPQKENITRTYSVKTPLDKENAPPKYSMNTPSSQKSLFTLHSEIRAKERAKFEQARRKNEQERKEELAKERSLSIQKKQRELERLRMLLR
jgi:hypothetical protein